MFKKSHTLIQREWKSNNDDTIVISQEGCIVDFHSLEMYGFFPMPDQPNVNPEENELQNEYVLFLGFKLKFSKTEEGKYLIDSDSEGYVNLLEQHKN